MSAPGDGGWLARAHQRLVDRAARRMFERLAADPAGFRRSPTSWGAILMSLLVLGCAVALLAGLIWLSFRGDGFWKWPVLVIGWLFVASQVRRPQRLPDDVMVLEADQFPAVHALVRHLSEQVGVKSPQIIGVNTDLNAYVAPVGLRLRSAMVVGLPMWTLLGAERSLGVIGHELGHLRGRDTIAGHVVWRARILLQHVIYVLRPADDVDSFELSFLTPILHVLQALLVAPFMLLFLALERSQALSTQHQEYLADRRSAQVVGSRAMADGLRMDIDSISVAARSAVLRGEDPFAVLAQRAASPTAALVPSDESHRALDSHPPPYLRVELLNRHATPAGAGYPPAELLRAADQELASLRDPLARQFRDQLRG